MAEQRQPARLEQGAAPSRPPRALTGGSGLRGGHTLLLLQLDLLDAAAGIDVGAGINTRRQRASPPPRPAVLDEGQPAEREAWAGPREGLRTGPEEGGEQQRPGLPPTAFARRCHGTCSCACRRRNARGPQAWPWHCSPARAAAGHSRQLQRRDLGLLTNSPLQAWGEGPATLSTVALATAPSPEQKASGAGNSVAET